MPSGSLLRPPQKARAKARARLEQKQRLLLALEVEVKWNEGCRRETFLKPWSGI